MGDSSAEVWYLDNSGFALKSAESLFIFDYCGDSPAPGGSGLDAGAVGPADMEGLGVTVFCSHAHGDHYSPAIFKWRDVPGLRYVLSADIRIPSGRFDLLTVRPDALYTLPGLSVRTFKSTDEGVAFLIEADGLRIFHAGDLNWWHWEGEPDDENGRMARDFKKQIDSIGPERIDAAFFPVDPRLGEQYLWGIRYFMEATDTAAVFPMHFGGDFSVFDRIAADPDAEQFRDRIVRIARRGGRFSLPRLDSGAPAV